MKVVHILSDEKFIDKHINKYDKSGFENFYIYLRSNYAYTVAHTDKVIYIEPKSSSYFKLIDEIDHYDIVILYFLQRDKLKFIKDLGASKIIVIWSFYGAELYSLPQLRYKMLSWNT